MLIRNNEHSLKRAEKSEFLEKVFLRMSEKDNKRVSANNLHQTRDLSVELPFDESNFLGFFSFFFS